MQRDKPLTIIAIAIVFLNIGATIFWFWLEKVPLLFGPADPDISTLRFFVLGSILRFPAFALLASLAALAAIPTRFQNLAFPIAYWSLAVSLSFEVLTALMMV